MHVTLKQVDAYMSLFHELQLKYGHRETGNVTQLKWDILAIAKQMEDENELIELIKFFLYYSDDKSLQYFSYTYDKYRETMHRVKIDRLRRMYLQEETLRLRKEKEQLES